MKFYTAPTVLHEPIVCTHCGDDQFVVWGHESICPECGYVRGSGGDDEPDHPWFKWRVIRNTRFEDEDDPVERRKVVGSYVHAYTDGEGNIAI